MEVCIFGRIRLPPFRYNACGCAFVSFPLAACQNAQLLPFEDALPLPLAVAAADPFPHGPKIQFQVEECKFKQTKLKLKCLPSV